MKNRVFAIVAATAFAISALAVPVSAAPGNGQAIGSDDLRLALTICSNAGIGNGGEYEAAFLLSVKSDCFNKRFLDKYSQEEVDAILAQLSCDVAGPFGGRLGPFYLFACEIDPGNSAAHNQAEQSNGDPQSAAAN